MAIIEDTPETEIRSDLWNTMTTSELAKQHDLMIKRMSAIQQLAGGQSATPSIMAIYSAMQMGFNDLNQLIEQRSAKER